MRIIFTLFKWFPWGGLQRDMLRIARVCAARGHQVEAWAMEAEGPSPDGLDLRVLPVRALGNHVRARRFARRVRQDRPAGSLLVGFNRMPGLDVYYAADTCFAAKPRPAWYRWLPRYRGFAALEAAVFAPDAGTDVLLIAPAQQAAFQASYGTPDARFHALPPGLERNRMAPDEATAAQLRASTRAALGVHAATPLLLQLGSGFRTKGLDRSIRALAAAPADTRLLVVGQDAEGPFRRLARQLGVADRVQFLGGRDDVPALLQAADLLVHPARVENTGTVLLEAVVAGLPVVTTAACGYAPHVLEAGAGLVLTEPFSQAALDTSIPRALGAPERAAWRAAGIRYGRMADLYSLPERAADVIEAAGRERACTG